MKKRIWILAVVIAAGLLASCAALQEMVQAPTVRVGNVAMNDFTFQDVTLDFGLDVNNPNVFGVELLGFDYQFVIEDNEFLKGTEDKTLSITPQSKSTVNIPIKINFKELYSLLTKVKDLDSLSYHLTGNFKPGGLLAGVNIPFNKKGTLPNVRVPKISLKGVKIDKMGFSGVDLAVNLGIENINSFAFNLGKLDYNISLGGNSVATGMTDKLAEIPAKQSGQVSIPLSLNLSGLSSLYSLLTGKSVDCGIVGSAQLNSPLGAFTLPIDASQNVKIFK